MCTLARKLKIFGGESFNFSFSLVSVNLAEEAKGGEVYMPFMQLKERGDVQAAIAEVCRRERERS